MVRLYILSINPQTNTSDLLLSNAWYCTNLFVKNENVIMPFWLKKIEFGLQVFCSKWKKAFKCSRVMAHTVQLMHDAYGPVTLFYYHLNWQLIAIWEFYYSHDWLSIYLSIWVILCMLHNFWIIMLFLQVINHIPFRKIKYYSTIYPHLTYSNANMPLSQSVLMDCILLYKIILL